ncbi:hypothetical protein DRH27_03555 [Candidatus Falkowbacteria bacterium]|nr:MAG: hypothetical protein DRH27_03555 [Candidatus Falkowbacteria bacterium]
MGILASMFNFAAPFMGLTIFALALPFTAGRIKSDEHGKFNILANTVTRSGCCLTISQYYLILARKYL